jgi:hypothetical protein
VPEIVKVQAFGADRARGVRPRRLPVEFPLSQRSALRTGKDQRTGVSGDKD